MNYIKRTISLLLFIGFLYFNKALAQTNPCPIYSTSPECITATVGDTIEVDVFVEGLVNMQILQFSLFFDLSVIEPIEDGTNSALLTNVASELQPPNFIFPDISYPNNSVDFFVFNTSPTNPISYISPTQIFTVSFVVTGSIGSNTILNLGCPSGFSCGYQYIDAATGQAVNDLSNIKVNGQTVINVVGQNQNPVCCDADNGTLSSGN